MTEVAGDEVVKSVIGTGGRDLLFPSGPASTHIRDLVIPTGGRDLIPLRKAV